MTLWVARGRLCWRVVMGGPQLNRPFCGVGVLPMRTPLRTTIGHAVRLAETPRRGTGSSAERDGEAQHQDCIVGEEKKLVESRARYRSWFSVKEFCSLLSKQHYPKMKGDGVLLFHYPG